MFSLKIQNSAKKSDAIFLKVQKSFNLKKMLQAVPHSELVLVPDAGHSMGEVTMINVNTQIFGQKSSDLK